MSDKVNALLERIKPSVKNTQMAQVFKYNEEISKIPVVIKLTLGEPDFNTPNTSKRLAFKPFGITRAITPPPLGTPKFVKRQPNT